MIITPEKYSSEILYNRDLRLAFDVEIEKDSFLASESAGLMRTFPHSQHLSQSLRKFYHRQKGKYYRFRILLGEYFIKQTSGRFWQDLAR